MFLHWVNGLSFPWFFSKIILEFWYKVFIIRDVLPAPETPVIRFSEFFLNLSFFFSKLLQFAFSIVIKDGQIAFNCGSIWYSGILVFSKTQLRNFAVSECDLLITVGARFDDRVTGKLDSFASFAKILHFDRFYMVVFSFWGPVLDPPWGGLRIWKSR